jgi:hypothetical protein
VGEVSDSLVNVGDYYRAVEEKIASETISKVLYPNDEPEAGKVACCGSLLWRQCRLSIRALAIASVSRSVRMF